MPTESATYYWVSCSAKVDNVLEPRCLARSEGGFADLDTVRKRALVAGWTSPTKTADYCPDHSRKSQIPTDTNPGAAIRRPRPAAPAQPAEPVPSTDQH